MTTLESRYRRLLSWYPADHRDRFGDEMLGVLMDGAEPQQQRPRLGETFDLMRNAVWKRIGQTGESTADGSPWAKAGAVVGLLASMLLFVAHARPAVGDLAMSYWLRERGHWSAPTELWIRSPMWMLMAAWLVATAVVLSKWRMTAIAVVWLAAFAEIGVAYFVSPNTYDMIYHYETIVIGFTAAIGVTTARTLAGTRVLGTRWTVTAIVVSLLMIGARLGDTHMGAMRWEGAIPTWSPGKAAFLAGGAIILVMVWRLGGPVRRRALAIAMSAVVVVLSRDIYVFLPNGHPLTASELIVVSLVAPVLSLVALRVWERYQTVRKAPPPMELS